MGLLLIVLLRQWFTSRFSNPAFRHLITLLSLSLKLELLLFSEGPLLIAGRSLQKASSEEGVYNGRKRKWSYDFSKEIFTR